MLLNSSFWKIVGAGERDHRSCENRKNIGNQNYSKTGLQSQSAVLFIALATKWVLEIECFFISSFALPFSQNQLTKSGTILANLEKLHISRKVLACAR